MLNTVYVLVGMPGVGKSTWINKNYPELPVVSSDNFIELMARRQCLTYTEVFQQYIKSALALVWHDIDRYVTDGTSFIIDQTNMRAGKRREILSKIPADWSRVAVVFEQPPPSIHSERLASRPGKVIPAHVLTSMANGYERPEFTEGFNEIRYVRTW
jgi:predicted kinase